MLPLHPATLARYLVITLLATAYKQSAASPWIDAGDARTRHHLLILKDAGKIRLPLNTWPLMWSGVKSELDELRAESLNQRELWSYQYLRHQLKRAMRETELSIQAQAASSPGAFADFSAPENDPQFGRISSTFTRTNFALKLSRSYVFDPLDDHTNRYDGSYVATTLGNWVLGVGAQSRWWGPGWQSSQVLSTNARPTPAFFVQRKDASAAKNTYRTPVSWDIALFAGELQQNDYERKPLFSGARLSVSPSRFLEIGAATTHISSGEIKQNDEPAEETESYKMISLDWRASTNASWGQLAVYQQIAQDNSELGENSYVYGIENAMLLGNTHTRVAIEYNDNTPVTTENSDLVHGYRNYERSLGSAFNFDKHSQSATLLAQHYFSNGHQLHWKLGRVTLNNDNTPEVAATEVAEQHAQNTSFAAVSYSAPVNSWLKISVGVNYFANKLRLADETISSGGYATFDLEF